MDIRQKVIEVLERHALLETEIGGHSLNRDILVNELVDVIEDIATEARQNGIWDGQDNIT